MLIHVHFYFISFHFICLFHPSICTIWFQYIFLQQIIPLKPKRMKICGILWLLTVNNRSIHYRFLCHLFCFDFYYCTVTLFYDTLTLNSAIVREHRCFAYQLFNSTIAMSCLLICTAQKCVRLLLKTLQFFASLTSHPTALAYILKMRNRREKLVRKSICKIDVQSSVLCFFV